MEAEWQDQVESVESSLADRVHSSSSGQILVFSSPYLDKGTQYLYYYSGYYYAIMLDNGGKPTLINSETSQYKGKKR